MLTRFGILFAALCASGVLAIAQPCQQGRQQSRLYDPSRETTITGTVQDVQQAQRGRMTGTHIMVKTETEIVDVRLGPSYFISDHGFTFAKGDRVEVVGAKTKVNDVEFLIAKEVTKDGKKLTLRDNSGRPLWARGRT